MNIQLSSELEQIVFEKVKSGNYNTTSEVLREALRLLEERDHFLEMHKVDLQKKIQEGLDSLNRGEGVDGKEVFARLDAKLDAAINNKILI